MPQDLSPLFNLGAVGAVLGWFLWQTNPRLERIEHAIDRLTRAIMLEVVARPDATKAVKEQAQAIIREVEWAEDKGGGRGK